MVELSRLVDAVIWKESDGKVDAVSPKGASGLMQLMPDTAREVAGKLGVPFDEKRLTTDAEYNKTLGTAYLQQMLDRYGGSHTLALAAYNAGPGNVDKWLTRYGDPRDGRITDDAWAASLPFKETRDYVKKVMANSVIYAALLDGKAPSLKGRLGTIAPSAGGDFSGLGSPAPGAGLEPAAE